MLERSQKKRPQSALFPAARTGNLCVVKAARKTLELYLLLPLAQYLLADEAINRPPVSAAKIFQRLLGRRRFALCIQHHAPVGGGKHRRCCNERFRQSRLVTSRHPARRARRHPTKNSRRKQTMKHKERRSLVRRLKRGGLEIAPPWIYAGKHGCERYFPIVMFLCVRTFSTLECLLLIRRDR